MSPDVASLCVYSEDALEAGPEGRHGWSVAMQQVVIVLQPVRQNIVGNHSPSALPHLGDTRVQWNAGTGAPSVHGNSQNTHISTSAGVNLYSKQRRVDGTSLGKRFYTWNIMLKSLFPVQNCTIMNCTSRERNTSAFYWTGRLLGVFTAGEEKTFNSLPCSVLLQAIFSI